MSKNTFNEVLAVALADATAVSNTTSETILIPDYTFAANDPHIYPGATWRVTVYFDVSFVVTTPGTLTLRSRWGGVAGTVLAASGAYAPSTTAVTSKSGWVEFLTTWRTIGSAGTAFTMGRWHINDFDNTSATTLQGNLQMDAIPTSAPAVVSSLDTTAAKNLSITAQFSVNTNPTNITAHQWVLEMLN